ncbi:MAG: hypothetical protein ACLQBB_05700 [Solirubrobacteraceae bacterium]
MTEIDGLVGIYGAVDRVVQTEPEARAQVARLLPLYRDPELQWYDEFEGWLKRERPEAAEHRETMFPPLQEALGDLAELPPNGRMRPRRMFAIALAARAFPEMRDPSSELGSQAVAALRAGSLVASERDARSLLELLVGEESLPSLVGTGSQELSAWWNYVIATAASQGLISDTTGMRPRPCSGRLVSVPGVAGPVAALKTEFVTEEIEFEAATRFIEPVNWRTCMPYFWCAMTQLGPARLPGVERYREVVSSDCPDKARAAFWAETELDFNFVWLPQGANQASAEAAITNYQLAEDRPLPGDLIRVDEGTLVVSRLGPGPKRLLITTTKRIQFSHLFSSQALAIIMCALGYADVVGDLLYCTASHATDPNAGTTFPGDQPTAPAPGTVPRSDRRPRTGSPSGESHDCIELMQDMAGMWTGLLNETATAVQRVAQGASGQSVGRRTRKRSEG